MGLKTKKREINMKYIDAEKLKKFIDEKWKKLADKNVKVGGGKWDAEISTYLSVLKLIDSLQQKQPEVQNGKFVFPKYLYARTVDNKTIDVSYAPQSMEAVEYIKNDSVEQQKVDLEKEIDNEWRKCLPTDEGMGLESANIVNEQFDVLARHFFELGQQEMRRRITNPEYNAKVVEQLKSEYPAIKEE